MNRSLQDHTKLIYGYFLSITVLIILTISIKGSVGLQWIFSGITVGSIYALLGMGFAVIYSSTHVINFAQGELCMLGGMFLYSFSVSGALPLWAGFILSILLVTAIGASLERVVIRTLKDREAVSVIVATIGLSIFLRAIAKWAWGTDPVPVTAFSGEKPIIIFKASVLPQTFWVVGLAATALLLIYLFLYRTSIGKGIRAVAMNKEAAALAGVSSSISSLIGWSIAAALGAAAGMVIAPINFMAYNSGVMLGLKGFTAAVIGGLDSISGAVVGGLSLGILEMITAGVFPSGYKDALAFVLLILVLLVRPQGLLGKPGEIKV